MASLKPATRAVFREGYLAFLFFTLASLLSGHPAALSVQGDGTENTWYYQFGDRKISIQRSSRHLSIRYKTPPVGEAVQGFVTKRGKVAARLRAASPGVVLLTTINGEPGFEDLDEIRQQLLRSPDILWVYPVFVHPPSAQLLLPTNEILLKVRSGVDAANLPGLLPQTVRLIRPMLYSDREFLLEVIDPKAADPLALANFLAETQPWVEWAQPNFIREYNR